MYVNKIVGIYWRVNVQRFATLLEPSYKYEVFSTNASAAAGVLGRRHIAGSKCFNHSDPTRVYTDERFPIFFGYRRDYGFADGGIRRTLDPRLHIDLWRENDTWFATASSLHVAIDSHYINHRTSNRDVWKFGNIKYRFIVHRETVNLRVYNHYAQNSCLNFQ